MHRSAHLTLVAALAVCFAFAASGCRGTGAYVWYTELPPDTVRANSEYIIAVGDVVSVRVLGHEEMTLRQRVRADGRLALLLIGDVEAAGKRPSALKAELEGRLKDYIVSPSVAVNIDEAQPMTVLVLGEVPRQGVYALDQDPRLVHAMALAGGLNDFASRSGVFVIRSDPRPERIRFDYNAIFRNLGGAGAFPLRRGDVVEVE